MGSKSYEVPNMSLYEDGVYSLEQHGREFFVRIVEGSENNGKVAVESVAGNDPSVSFFDIPRTELEEVKES